MAAARPAAGRRRVRDADLTEGERWARVQLAELRAAGFAPHAVARFLAESQRRANEQRAARPLTARRTRAWIAVGAGAWAAPALTGREPFRRRGGAFAAWWALIWLMLDWHIGMLETEDGEARNLGPADACTLLRVWLVPAAADEPRPWMCALAFASDALDGRLARATAPTRFGRDLEGVADAAFAVAALRGARRHGWIGAGAARAELARIALGAGYAVADAFGASAPDLAVLRAARPAAPIRAAALVAAGLGRRRLAERLLIVGAAWSGAATAAAILRRA